MSKSKEYVIYHMLMDAGDGYITQIMEAESWRWFKEDPEYLYVGTREIENPANKWLAKSAATKVEQMRAKLECDYAEGMAKLKEYESRFLLLETDE